MELQVGVKALIQNPEGKYLFLKRKKILIDEKQPSWTIPGGRIHPEEPILQGLAREVKEETDLTITNTPQFVYAQDIFRPHLNRHIVRLIFKVEARGTINIGNDTDSDHAEFRWLKIDEVMKLGCEKELVPALNSLH